MALAAISGRRNGSVTLGVRRRRCQRRRPNNRARTALARILQDTGMLSPGVLARGFMWPEELRDRPRHHTIPASWSSADVEEADQFNADHPSNPDWHFVAWPLRATGYPATDPAASDPLCPFVSAADIVHALRRCIAILEASTEDPAFTKRPAVRWLVRLVEDLHQPLHATSGYFRLRA